MQLPNGHRPVVDLRKIREYCLDRTHPRGRHKARVFASVLGLTREHSSDLQEALSTAAHFAEAIQGHEDGYGQRYTVDFRMDGPNGSAMVRSHWIIRVGEDFPRFTSCYVRCDNDPMEQPELELLDVVALAVDVPARGLRRGQVGTIVEHLDDRVFEVEFSDEHGRMYSSLALAADQVIPLFYHPVGT